MLKFCLMLLAISLTLQGKPMETKDYKKLSKPELIEMAAKKLQSSHENFSRNLFDRIEVKSENDRMIIDFDISLKYIPLNSEAYYRAAVFFGKHESTACYPLKNPSDFENNNDTFFFKPDAKALKSIAFIKDAIVKSGITLFKDGKVLDGYTIEAYEAAGHYFLVVDNDSSTGRFKIDNKTGKVYDQSHKHKMMKD